MGLILQKDLDGVPPFGSMDMDIASGMIIQFFIQNEERRPNRRICFAP